MSSYSIESDPNYLALRNLIQAQSSAEAAQRGAAAQQAIVGFGEAPAALPAGLNANWYNTDITDTTRGLASQNTTAGLSTLARLMHGFQNAQRGALNQLADRGMLQSGETGYQLGELGLGYKQQQYDARTDLLARLTGLYSTAAQNEQARQMQLAQLAMQVAQDRAANPANQGGGSVGGGTTGGGGQGGTGGGGGGSTGGGTAGGGGGGQAGGGGTPSYPVPTAAEIALMDRYDGVASGQRPKDVLELYRKYEQWRLATPGWNNPSPGGVAPATAPSSTATAAASSPTAPVPAAPAAPPPPPPVTTPTPAPAPAPAPAPSAPAAPLPSKTVWWGWGGVNPIPQTAKAPVTTTTAPASASMTPTTAPSGPGIIPIPDGNGGIRYWSVTLGKYV